MGVKKEDWYVFVDMESTEEARIRREKGKATRKEMNNPHTTGRRGAARTTEILVANNPNEPGTRTDFFMATHTRPDESFLDEEIGEKMLMIKDILARDPSSKHKDLNHDPVAEVFGKDGRGTVKGYGHGVSKTTLMAAAPYKKKAQEEYMSRLELQRKMDNMECQMDEDIRERREMQEQLNALLRMPGSSQGSHKQFSASQVVFHEASINPLPRQSIIPIEQACELLSIGGRIVAYGTIANIEGPTYKIVIDEVKDWSAELFGVRGRTFGDIDVGHPVQWPTVLTRQLV